MNNILDTEGDAIQRYRRRVPLQPGQLVTIVTGPGICVYMNRSDVGVIIKCLKYAVHVERTAEEARDDDFIEQLDALVEDLTPIEKGRA